MYLTVARPLVQPQVIQHTIRTMRQVLQVHTAQHHRVHRCSKSAAHLQAVAAAEQPTGQPVKLTTTARVLRAQHTSHQRTSAQPLAVVQHTMLTPQRVWQVRTAQHHRAQLASMSAAHRQVAVHHARHTGQPARLVATARAHRIHHTSKYPTVERPLAVVQLATHTMQQVLPAVDVHLNRIRHTSIRQVRLQLAVVAELRGGLQA